MAGQCRRHWQGVLGELTIVLARRNIARGRTSGHLFPLPRVGGFPGTSDALRHGSDVPANGEDWAAFTEIEVFVLPVKYLNIPGV